MDTSPGGSKPDVNKFFGKCRCCLEYGYMKDMWAEYNFESNSEVYGEMLMDTFSIPIAATREKIHLICEMCIQKLRDATSFKLKVQASEKLMYDNVDDSEHEGDLTKTIKCEEIDFESEMKEEVTSDVEHIEEEFNEDIIENDENEYYEVEYLEMDDTDPKPAPTQENTAPETEITEPPKSKWPKRKHRSEITRTYKNYSTEDLKACLEAVNSGEMTTSEACKQFNIPKKTIAAKVCRFKKTESPEELEKLLDQGKHHSFIEEVKKILAYTSAIPFKIKGAHYYCPYCFTNSKTFDDPDDLRIHLMSHKSERVSSVFNILRPSFLNEILRVDIENLRCVVCDERLIHWNDMFQHLYSAHDVILDQAYARLIPFKLAMDNINCALCDTQFQNFRLLDAHMNAHYTNYMCSECGDTFLAETRLKHHILIHNRGKFTCNDCGKVFTLEKYLKKHISMVHDKVKSFKCSYCDERFISEYERHTHVLDKHNEKVRVCTCEICGKTFDWRPYYMAHMRKIHLKNKKYKCKYCPKRFMSKHEIKMHEMRHTGSGKHVCGVCGKNYVTSVELRKHFKRHTNENIYILRTDA